MRIDSPGKASKSSLSGKTFPGRAKLHEKRFSSVLSDASASKTHENVSSVAISGVRSPLFSFSLLNSKELKVLKLLFLRGRRLSNAMSIKQLERLSNLSKWQLYKILKRLSKLGLVNRLGWGLYCLNESAILLLLGNVFAAANLLGNVSMRKRFQNFQMHDYLVGSVQGHQLKYLPLPPLDWSPGSLFLHGGMFLVEFEGSKGRMLYDELVRYGRFRVVRLRNGVRYVLVRLDRSGLRITLEVFSNGTVKLHVRGDPVMQFEVRDLVGYVLSFVREFVDCRGIRLILRDFELTRVILDKELVKVWKSLGLKYYKIYLHGDHIREEWRFSGYNVLVTGQFELQDVLEHIRLRLFNARVRS